jgi:tetratricopeptide (TPR) repeat protein
VPDEKNLYHRGSGFGALEIMRMKEDGDGEAPTSTLFPVDTIGKDEELWLGLLNDGIIKETDTHVIQSSYMVSPKWIDRMLDSINKKGGYNWHSLLHLGIAIYEYHNVGVTARLSYSEEENALQTKKARELWLASVKEKPNYWAYRNLAVLERQAGDRELAEKYYDLAVSCDGAFDDFALASEYLVFLLGVKNYEKIWQIYNILPQNCKDFDRVKITTAKSAVKLGKLDYLENFFIEEHHDIREGEVSLSDVWFEYCALKMAKERGMDNLTAKQLDELIDEAWDKYPPSKDIDFRMSTDKKFRYRISE